MGEQKELASSRLAELETLQGQYQQSLRTIEQLKMDVSSPNLFPLKHGLEHCLSSFRWNKVLLCIQIYSAYCFKAEDVA